MSLTLALSNALSGLEVSQNALSTTSNNIANANTEGYSRQIVDQSAVTINDIGNGVQVADISRRVDVYLERTIRSEISNVGYNEVVDDYYDRMQILYGEPGANNSIDEYVENYFNALQSLAETPNFTSFQSEAVNAGEILARELSSLAESLEDLRFQADRDISEAVNFVNSELEHLEAVNISLNRASVTGQSNPTLLDERDIALENIAEYLDISTYFTDTGQVNVATKSGISLVNEVSNRLDYRTVESVASLINNIAVNPLQIEVIGQRGDVLSTQDLISAGIEDGVTSELRSGKLEALHQIRDILIPEVLSQLDELAARLRDEMNAIHNDGSGFPAASEFTGTRAFRADDEYDWTGQVQIAVVNEDGTPVRSTYVDESYTGYRPLTLDFEFLDSGFGDGTGVPRMQTIIDEINNHFNAPPIKAVVNNLNNIQMVSNTDRVPNSATPTMDVDFDLENISATDSDFWVTGVQILNDVGVDISASTDTLPRVTINALAGFDFNVGSTDLRINTDSDHGLQVGDRVFIEDPGTLPAVFASGVPSGSIIGYVEVTEIVDQNTFIFNTGVTAAATTTEGTGGGVMSMLPPWHEVEAGDKSRARDSGLVTLDFTGDVSSTYYDVTFTVGVYADDNDQVDIAQVTYRVENNQTNLYNDRFDITGLTGTGEAFIPDTPHQYLIAEMVDEDGNPLQRTNGSYGSQEGYLRLTANPIGTDESFSIVIDELDGSQNGRPYLAPPEEGTERGFSHYFELNNFFTSNIPTDEGDTTDGSAYALAVEERLLDDPSLISTGDLQLSNQPADPDATPLYTYERFESDNSVVQRMASLAFETVSFEEAGGLPNTSLTFTGYTSEILGYQATQAATAESRYEDNDALLQGFVERADTFSGVNLDEELANTIIFQNAYAASARVITVTDEMFETLLGAF